MLSFEPKLLNEIKQQLIADFPLPQDYALKEESFALEIIGRIRNGGISFLELPASDFNYIFQLANLCTQAEYEQLSGILPYRITSNLYDIGWVFCQYNPNNKHATEIFSVICRWMKQNRREDYNKTLVGRTDLPWGDIYIRSVEIMRIKKLTIEQFCKKFDIIPDTVFYQQLNMVYLSRCEKEELLASEALLAQLISTSELEFLRPTIKNYTAQVHYDEMSQLINDAISYRLSRENSDESIGLSPNMLQRIRQQRFNSVLSECTGRSLSKQNVYNSIAGRIKNIELLTGGFYSIDFGLYIVVDNIDWKDEAFAYAPATYGQLLDEWKEAGYPDHFWPAMDGNLIATARDVIFGMKKAAVIKLGFADFDILYTKDLLSFSRY